MDDVTDTMKESSEEQVETQSNKFLSISGFNSATTYITRNLIEELLCWDYDLGRVFIEGDTVVAEIN